MKTETQIIQTAEFNPKIKVYILLSVAFVMAATIVGIPLIIIWLLGFGQLISKHFYENLKCELTNRHLEFKKGILFKVEKTIPLENIQDLTFIENPLLRYLDLRILKIETAGQSNPQGSDMTLVGIVNCADFKEKILQQRELLKNESKLNNKQPAENNDQIIDILKDIKDILNDIRNK